MVIQVVAFQLLVIVIFSNLVSPRIHRAVRLAGPIAVRSMALRIRAGPKSEIVTEPGDLSRGRED